MKKGILYFDPPADVPIPETSLPFRKVESFPCGYKLRDEERRQLSSLYQMQSPQVRNIDSVHYWTLGEPDLIETSPSRGSTMTNDASGPRFFDYESITNASNKTSSLQLSHCTLRIDQQHTPMVYNSLPQLIKMEEPLPVQTQQLLPPRRHKTKPLRLHKLFSPSLQMDSLLDAPKDTLKIEVFRGAVVEYNDSISEFSAGESESTHDKDYISAYYEENFYLHTSIEALRGLIYDKFKIARSQRLRLTYHDPLLLSWMPLSAPAQLRGILLRCQQTATPLKIMFTTVSHHRLMKGRAEFKAVALRELREEHEPPRLLTASTSLATMLMPEVAPTRESRFHDKTGVTSTSGRLNRAKQDTYAQILEAQLMQTRW